jgi:hypothetical protein
MARWIIVGTSSNLVVALARMVLAVITFNAFVTFAAWQNWLYGWPICKVCEMTTSIIFSSALCNQTITIVTIRIQDWACLIVLIAFRSHGIIATYRIARLPTPLDTIIDSSVPV